MALTNWTTTFIDGKEFLVIDVAKFRIPLDWDPNSGLFFAVAAPDGGLGGFPALAQGEDGETPNIDTTINLDALEWDDPTPDSASWTELSENLYQLNLALHKGEKGDAASFDLEDADNLVGTLTAGYGVVVNPAADGFVYAAPKVGDTFWPSSFNNVPSGNPAYTLCAVPVAAQPVDWRPEVTGWCILEGTGSDVQVDLIARIDDEDSGNICGRGRWRAIADYTEATQPCILTSGPPAGSPRDHNLIAAGDSAVIYLRTERQSGANTYTASNTAMYFNVKVQPIP